jgi:hypothetical protein
MSLIRLVLIACVVLLAGCPESPAPPKPAPNPRPAPGPSSEPAAEPAESSLKIAFREVLTEITIEGDRMTYAWQAPPEGAGNLVDPSEYSWRSEEVALTAKNIELLHTWLDTTAIMSFTGSDAPGDAEAYPTVWFHSFEITRDGATHSVRWTDGDTWDNPERQRIATNMVEQFKVICSNFRKNADADQAPPEQK